MTDFAHAGIRLKTARMAAGFKSAREFCDKYRIPASTYSLHETGGRNLKSKIAESYSHLLGINAAWLLTGTGSPFLSTESEEEHLSDSEFLALLQYQGNDKITSSLLYQNEFINNVNALVFCTIVIKMVEILHEMNVELSHNQLTKKAVEIYKDIILSSNEQKAQLTMIDLSITTFKRQIQELADNDK